MHFTYLWFFSYFLLQSFCVRLCISSALSTFRQTKGWSFCCGCSLLKIEFSVNKPSWSEPPQRKMRLSSCFIERGLYVWVFWSLQLSYQALCCSVQTSCTRLKAKCDCLPLQSWMSHNFTVQSLKEKYSSISLMIIPYNEFINAAVWEGKAVRYSVKSLLLSSTCKLQILHDAQVQLLSVLLFKFIFPLFCAENYLLLPKLEYRILLSSLLDLIINRDYLLSTPCVSFSFIFFAVSTLNVGALSIVLALSATALHYLNDSQTVISGWLMKQPFLNSLLFFTIGKTALNKLLSMLYSFQKSLPLLAITSLHPSIINCPSTYYVCGLSLIVLALKLLFVSYCSSVMSSHFFSICKPKHTVKCCHSIFL